MSKYLVIDDMDALSFNYEDKEFVVEQYTPRRVYERKKPLENGLKKQLVLNFDALYEEDMELAKKNVFPTF